MTYYKMHIWLVYKNVLQRKYFPALDIRVIKENYMLWVVHPLLYCIYFQFVKFRVVKMYLMQKMKGNLCECIWNKLSQRIVRGVQLSCFDCNCCARTSRVLSREALPGISTRTLLVWTFCILDSSWNQHRWRCDPLSLLGRSSDSSSFKRKGIHILIHGKVFF